MTVREGERLAILETKVDELTRRLGCIDEKLDLALENKADQTEVDTISNRLWWFIGIFVVAFLGVVGSLIEAHF